MMAMMTMSLQCFLRSELVGEACKQSEVQRVGKTGRLGSYQGSDIATGRSDVIKLGESIDLKNEGR